MDQVNAGSGWTMWKAMDETLARPVTHAVLVFAALDPALAAELLRASETAGIELL